MALHEDESYNILRPETAETYFYMWRLTKQQKYRDWASEAMQVCIRCGHSFGMTFSMSAVSLFECGELRCIKAVSNNNDDNRGKGL